MNSISNVQNVLISILKLFENCTIQMSDDELIECLVKLVDREGNVIIEDILGYCLFAKKNNIEDLTVAKTILHDLKSASMKSSALQVSGYRKFLDS